MNLLAHSIVAHVVEDTMKRLQQSCSLNFKIIVILLYLIRKGLILPWVLLVELPRYLGFGRYGFQISGHCFSCLLFYRTRFPVSMWAA